MLDQAACWHAHLSAIAAMAWRPHRSPVDNRRQNNDRVTDEADASRVAIRAPRHCTAPPYYPFRIPTDTDINTSL